MVKMFSTILLTVLLAYVIYRATARPVNFPPGPFNLPIVGYLPFVGRQIHHTMTELSEKYGDIFGLNFGSQRVIFLNSLSVIREAFKEDALTGRPDFPFFLRRSDNKRGIFFSEGHNWHEMRRFALRSLRDFGFGKSTLESMVQDEINELMSNLLDQSGQPIQLANRFNLAVVNALWTIMTGKRFAQDDPAAMQSIKQLNEVIANNGAGSVGDFMPFLTKFGPLKKSVDNRMEQLSPMFKLVMDAVSKHEDSHTEGDESDFIHAFIERMRKERDPQSPFSDTEGQINLKNVVVDLFIAGTETTSTSLLWFFLLLATYPQIQEKIQKEIDEHVPRDEMPNMEHRLKLNYTEAAIRESMRYASLTPLGVFHTAVKDFNLKGYTIPSGTIIFANLYKIHHSPEHWERPNEFYPEHFLDANGSVKAPEAFIPFSTGKRVCLGESLARMELYLFATSLLQKFTFKFPADRPPPSLNPNPTGGVILSPIPFDIIVETRK